MRPCARKTCNTVTLCAVNHAETDEITFEKTNGSSPPLNSLTQPERPLTPAQPAGIGPEGDGPMNPTLLHEKPAPVEPISGSPEVHPDRPKPKRPIWVKTKVSLWNDYFPDVSLTDPRWIERHTVQDLKEALPIVAEKDRAQGFRVRDQENIGRYLSAVIGKKKRGVSYSGRNRVSVISLQVTAAAGYEFTERDKDRFKSHLVKDGDCLRWNGSHTEDNYGRFKVNGKAMSAHYVALYMEAGCLPADGELDGQRFNVSHNCRHRDCCNPKHLRLLTKRLNLLERQI